MTPRGSFQRQTCQTVIYRWEAIIGRKCLFFSWCKVQVGWIYSPRCCRG